MGATQSSFGHMAPVACRGLRHGAADQSWLRLHGHPLRQRCTWITVSFPEDYISYQALERGGKASNIAYAACSGL
ncbi:hypothetical protein LMG23994_00995 [Cupriavidus pinatubonensis]|uniref:Uncharacterized protein n=1 Tax=Cupriavidus pinatubonensis TaxID=248026 RepID=A0ABM8WGI9_9BURK|nr:hypothetical protein LMG23994_00995 [Cupriavidus pinatubonensis]